LVALLDPFIPDIRKLRVKMVDPLRRGGKIVWFTEIIKKIEASKPAR
jgi:hypothetical protein